MIRPIHFMIRPVAITCLGLTLILGSPAAQAQQQRVPNAVSLEAEQEEVPRYAVELIVFEYVGEAAQSTEIFEPEQASPPLPEDVLATGSGDISFGDPASLNEALPVAIDDSLPDDAPAEVDEEATIPEYLLAELEEIETLEQTGMKPMLPEDYQLTDVLERLEAIDAYRPLMHAGWIQPTLEKEFTKPLKLRRIGNPPLRLDGTISLYLSRFLHLVVDLSLEHKRPQRMTASQQRLQVYRDSRMRLSSSFDAEFIAPSVFYRIEEDRIVRNNELRYFDHPKFGVIAKVTRIEEAPPEAPDNTGDLLPGNPN